MSERCIQEPEAFIRDLRTYHETPEQQRGNLANGLSDLIIEKRVDIAQVRARLEESDDILLQTLDQLLDLIEPYLDDGGADE